jgi:hypothetical protein
VRKAGSREGSLGDRRFGVVALPPDTQLLDFDIIEGRKLDAARHGRDRHQQRAAGTRSEDARWRDSVLRIAADEKTWRVVGIAREAFAPLSRGYIPLTGMVNSCGSRSTTRSGCDQCVEASWIEISSARCTRARQLDEEREPVRFDQHMLMIYVFLIVMSAIVGGVGGLG